MKILLDIQSLQTNSRKRGIGRYTFCFLSAFYKINCEDNVILLINPDPSLSPDKLEGKLRKLFPLWSIVRLHAPKLLPLTASVNSHMIDIADEVRGFFINELQPDIFHIFSYFEGYRDPSVTGFPERYLRVYPVTVTLFDLIPLLNPQEYLDKDPTFCFYYLQKIKQLSCFDHFLAISHSAKQEIVDSLGIEPSRASVTTLGPMQEHSISSIQGLDTQMLQALDIKPGFLLYVGGADSRKNLHRLVEAWCLLEASTQQAHPIVFAGNIPDTIQGRLIKLAIEKQGAFQNIVFLGEVTDQQLEVLYKYCRLFVFPSWHEGFGLPVLEAMVAGCVSICANTSSLPEVIGIMEAQFNPFDIYDIASLIKRGLYDESFRSRFRSHAMHHSQHFTWGKTVDTSYEAWRTLLNAQETDSISTLNSSNYADRLESMVNRISKMLACIRNPLERNLYLDQIVAGISENEKALEKLRTALSAKSS